MLASPGMGSRGRVPVFRHSPDACALHPEVSSVSEATPASPLGELSPLSGTVRVRVTPSDSASALQSDEGSTEDGESLHILEHPAADSVI